MSPLYAGFFVTTINNYSSVQWYHALLNNKEITMKYVLAMLSMVLITTAQAQSVINYDDGSTYTLKENEQIYITKGALWSLTQKDTLVQFKKATPNSVRDYVEPEPVENLICWPWGGVAAPYGYSADACEVKEVTPQPCDPDGFTFGGYCSP